jgi:ParB-like chromosome segregation protein Spo0J
MVPVADLVPYERNSRTHSPQQINKLAELIREFGWTNPLIADINGIVAGHGRLQAAKQIYASGGTINLPSGDSLPQGHVPVIDCTGWSDQQRRAYIIADNRSAEDAGWDKELLKLELHDLQEAGLNLQLTGFDESEIDKLLIPPEPPQLKEWDLSATYEPFWIVIRGPIDRYPQIMAALESLRDEHLVVEGSL